MPYADPADRRARQRAWAADRRAAGRGASCPAQALPGMSRCQTCRDKKNRQQNGKRRKE